MTFLKRLNSWSRTISFIFTNQVPVLNPLQCLEKGKTWKRKSITGLESRFQDVVSFRSNKDLGKVKHDDDSKLRIINICSVITRM